MGQITTLPIQTIAATKALLGLGNVDNTSDANKPISIAVQAALDGKRPSSQPIPLADLSQTGATVGQVLKWNGFEWAPGTDLVGEGGGGSGITTVFGRTGPDIVPEAGDYTFAQISQKPTTLTGYGITDATPNTHIGAGGAVHSAATSSVAGFMAAADKLKLDGITVGATANSPDATLLDRNNHTGAQAIGTITGLQGALDGKAPINNPTFTGTVAGITKAMVGLSNVDNTSDTGKPVSTAQAAAIALRNAGIQWQNGGTNLGAAATVDTVNAGSGMTASRVGNVVTLSSTGVAQNALTPASSTAPPTVDAVVTALADKASSFELSNAIDNVNANLGAQIASKENALTFTDLAERSGNVISVKAPKVAGDPLDGLSGYMLPGNTAFQSLGPQWNPNMVPGGGYTNRSTANPTNAWKGASRGQLTGATGAANHARLYTPIRARWPDSNTNPYGGFKVVGTYAAADALTCYGAFGIVQNVPAIGTAPSAYTGGRFIFAYEAADTTLKVYAGSTLVKDLGASFPPNGNETNPYRWEIEVLPYPSYGVKWKITHILTGAVDSGFYNGVAGGYNTGGLPAGDHEPNILLVRDSNGSTTSAVMTSTGFAMGAWRTLVVGDSSGQIPTPNVITASVTLTRAAHANLSNRVKSATPVTLTVKASGYVDGDVLYGVNRGAGAITFAGEGGFTIHAGPDIPATCEQDEPWSLEYDGVDNVWTRTA